MACAACRESKRIPRERSGRPVWSALLTTTPVVGAFRRVEDDTDERIPYRFLLHGCSGSNWMHGASLSLHIEWIIFARRFLVSCL